MDSNAFGAIVEEGTVHHYIYLEYNEGVCIKDKWRIWSSFAMIS